MKLGYVAEQDRLPDSPDTVAPFEPTIGAISRSKGSLYLLVTGRTPGSRFGELTRQVAETIHREYYYDESAGIAVCLSKAIKAANKKLGHQRDRVAGDEANGPIGVAAAVVRGNELYVVTIGPAQAYLIRQARLSTLPDLHRERGLPTTEIEPDVWRGEVSVGDSVVLASPNLMARLGPDELKDAMVTLHPQSAMEHLHHRFIAADGSGSDGAIAFEATEVSATTKQRKLVPVKPAEPLAGSPDRSPIPLADSVTAGAAAVSQSARQATSAAGGAAGRFLGGMQDRLPRRSDPTERRVTGTSARRETQRRAAVAVLALVVVVATLGIGVWLFAGKEGSPGTLGSQNAGQKALMAAQTAIGQVYGPGVDLVKNDPPRATDLLSEAWRQLDAAAAAGVPAAAIDPLRAKARGGLDELYRMEPVVATALLSLVDAKPAVDLRGLALGPDNAPYVLDAATHSVYRIDVKAGKAGLIVKAGQAVDGTKVGEPTFIARAGPDLLILDAKNVLWRWRPADRTGSGTLRRVKVLGAAGWGDDVRAMGAFETNHEAGLYRLYVVDPSAKQILAYSPAADGGGFPGAASPWLAAPQDVSAVDSMLIDGDIYLSRSGSIARFIKGGNATWKPADPGDSLLRAAPVYSLLATGAIGSDKDKGPVYGYDRPNGRVIALAKDGGSIVGQYRLNGGDPAWADLRGMYVVAGLGDEPATLVWIDKNRVMSSILEAVQTPTASPGPGSGASPSVKPSATPKATKKPTKTPKP
jgi:hypothetical protein